MSGEEEGVLCFLVIRFFCSIGIFSFFFVYFHLQLCMISL